MMQSSVPMKYPWIAAHGHTLALASASDGVVVVSFMSAFSYRRIAAGSGLLGATASPLVSSI
jgi:hypothetical protein